MFARMMPITLQLLGLLALAPPNVFSSTEGDQKAAEFLLSSIDESKDPCADFYEFTCANWIKRNPIPADEGSISGFSIIARNVKQQLRELYESKQSSSSRAINDAKLLYSACMDTTRINKIGSRDLLRDLEELCYWPLIHGNLWSKQRFDLTHLLIGMGTTRQSVALFRFNVMADEKNVTRNVAYFDQDSLALARETYLQSEYADKLAIYERYLVKKVSLLAQDAYSWRKPEQIAKDVKEVVAFEKQLAAILTPEEDRRDPQQMYHLARLSDLYKLVPQIDWFRYFRAVMPSVARNYLSTNPQIVVQSPAYFRKLAKLLRVTNARTLTNYLLLRYTSSWADELGEKYDAAQAEYSLEMTGSEREPRWKTCSSAVLDSLPQAAGALYVRHYFNETSQARVVDMVANIRKAYRGMISESDWMDPKTKQYALEKADAMEFTIGFARMHFNDLELDEYHQGINLMRRDTFTTVKAKLAQYAMRKSVKRLLGPVDRTEFDMSPAVVNGYYDPTKNGIFFLAALLQPYFELDLPSVYTYASIGAVVGHEITHGFDDAGAQYDKVGNLKSWWDNATLARFTSRTQCIVDEYSKFVVEEIGMNVNGRLTLGENVADNGALKASFRAFTALEQPDSSSPVLPGLDAYTAQQLFFMSYGQFWCTSRRPDAARHQLLTDPHSPGKFRVNGAVVNLPEFATAFSCPLGSPMNPRDKCTVW